jgi:hypothetical protein
VCRVQPQDSRVRQAVDALRAVHRRAAAGLLYVAQRAAAMRMIVNPGAIRTTMATLECLAGIQRACPIVPTRGLIATPPPPPPPLLLQTSPRRRCLPATSPRPACFEPLRATCSLASSCLYHLRRNVEHYPGRNSELTEIYDFEIGYAEIYCGAGVHLLAMVGPAGRGRGAPLQPGALLAQPVLSGRCQHLHTHRPYT